VGPYSDIQSFTYTPPPPSPEPEPPNVGDKELKLRWPAGEPGQTFRLQIARDAEFTDLAVDKILEEAGYAMKRPRSGTYFLRVATIDVDGTAGAFGTAQQFEVPFNRWSEIIFGVFSTIILLL
jgi:hypothetical protein